MMFKPIQTRYILAFFLVFLTQLAHSVAPNSVIATVGVGLNPNGVAITPDGKFAYVADNNDNNIPGAHTVSVIDTATNLLCDIISDVSFDQPYTISIKDAGDAAGKAYVTNSNGTTVTIIDLSDNSILGTITGFDGPSGFAINPAGTIAYVNNYGSPAGVMSGNGNTINVVDLNTNMITVTFDINPPMDPPAAPAALAVSPDGDFLYVANYVDGNTGTGTISVIQTSDNTIVDTIAGLSGPFAIIITSDSRTAYVTNFGSNNFAPVGTTVSVVDLTTNAISDTIEVGIQPSGIALTPDEKYLYVSNYNTIYLQPAPVFGDLTAFQGTVNIIRTSDNTVILPTIIVGSSPAAIAITPDGKYAYVTNYTSNNVSVIGIPLFEVTAKGYKTANVFLMQKDIINKLTWTVAGTDLPVKYSIYRDALLTDLVATVPAAGTLSFLDHNRGSSVVYTYYIVGINAADITSYPVAVTVTENC